MTAFSQFGAAHLRPAISNFHAQGGLWLITNLRLKIPTGFERAIISKYFVAMTRFPIGSLSQFMRFYFASCSRYQRILCILLTSSVPRVRFLDPPRRDQERTPARRPRRTFWNRFARGPLGEVVAQTKMVPDEYTVLNTSGSGSWSTSTYYESVSPGTYELYVEVWAGTHFW